MTDPTPSRRDVLTGRALRAQVAAAQDALAGAVLAEGETPQSGPTVRLGVRAMATEFGILLNPGPTEQVKHASHALDVIGRLEQQLTVFRDDSDVSKLNRTAAEGPVTVDDDLFNLLRLCDELAKMTGGAFDPATQSQIALWAQCRSEHRVPGDEEIEAALSQSGMRHVRLDAGQKSVAFDRPGVGFNFGAIGKGYALDRCSDLLDGRGAGGDGEQQEAPLIASYCLHGGHSSVLARGDHNGLGGWPVGIGNPLFTSRRLGTILLRDRALGTSGSNIQFYRHEGSRYGHILDPRTARPVGDLLSVTVLAPSAAVADALSTAFFVLGVEKTAALCDNQSLIGALLIPPPRRGGRLEPVICGLPEDILFLDPEQVTVTRPG